MAEDKPLAQRMQRFMQGRPAAESLPAMQEFLSSDRFRPATVIATDGRAIVLDLSRTSPMLAETTAGIEVDALCRLIDTRMHAAGTAFAFGRYAEHRGLYDNDNFAGDESAGRRSIHLGIDLFCVSGTPVCAPLDAEITIIANNTQDLDYGPMLVLRHDANGHDFFSLYGHLSLRSLSGLREGQMISAGQPIAQVGAPPENGNWPPHLHVQLIADLLGLGRDFPGVASPGQKDFWLALSPNPAGFFPDCAAALLTAPHSETR